MTQNITFLIAVLFSTILGAQTREVEVSSKYNSDRELYEISVKNNTDRPKTVLVEFPTLRGLDPSMPLPAIIEVPPRGLMRNLTLRKSGIGSPSFRYQFTHYTGCAEVEVNKEIIYALPFRNGYETIPYPLTSMGNYLKKEARPEDYNAMAFLMEKGDTVHLSRKGVVETVKKDAGDRVPGMSFSSEVNYVLIRHDDCSLGKYSNFDKGQIFVSPGDKLNVGDALGIVNHVPYNGNIQVRQAFYYFDILNVIKNGSENKAQYFPVKFQTKRGVIEEWDFRDTYEANVSDELIFQEMSKRDIKRWRKAKVQ